MPTARVKEKPTSPERRGFTIRTTTRRLARVGDLWAPVLGPGPDVAACVDRLAAVAAG